VNALEDIINSFKTPISKIETDRGSEFINSKVRQLFKSHNIFFKNKYGKNKCAFAERYIYIVKRKLFMLLRSSLSENWVKFLPIVINNLNNLPLQKLGYLKPKDIQSEKSSVEVDKAKLQHHIEIYKQPNIFEQDLNKKLDLKSAKSLKVGDYVFKQFDTKLFDKKYNIAVSIFT